MTDYVYKSAITGAFVSAQYAAENPDTTYRDTIDRDEPPAKSQEEVTEEAVNPDPGLDGDEGYPE